MTTYSNSVSFVINSVFILTVLQLRMFFVFGLWPNPGPEEMGVLVDCNNELGVVCSTEEHQREAMWLTE